jgi:hypothetical protein
MRIALMVIVSLVGTACGSSEGSACPTPNAQECASAKSLLVCEGASWRAYPCPSCNGGKCDWKGAASGDSCPKVAETYGTCTLDGRIVGCFFSTTADAGVFVESACQVCTAGKSIEELGKCNAGRCSCQ